MTAYITEVEKEVDKIRDKLVSEMKRLGSDGYRQVQDQRVNKALDKAGLILRPAGEGDAFVISRS